MFLILIPTKIIVAAVLAIILIIYFTKNARLRKKETTEKMIKSLDERVNKLNKLVNQKKNIGNLNILDEVINIKNVMELLEHIDIKDNINFGNDIYASTEKTAKNLSI